MGRREELEKQLNITPGVRDKHDYHLDPSFRDGGSRYMARLPDRTLVPADEYEDRLREYHERQRATAGAEATIRDVVPDDAGAMAGLVEQLGYDSDEARMRQRLAGILQREDYATFVAEAAGRVIGFVGVQLCESYNRDRPTGRLVSLVVDRSARGNGVGGRLVERAEAWLVAAGAAGVFVNSQFHRKAAHAFYEKRGYAQNGVRLVRTFDRDDATESR